MRIATGCPEYLNCFGWALPKDFRKPGSQKSEIKTTGFIAKGIASAIHSLDRALELLLRIGRKHDFALSIVAEFLKTHTNQSLACWDLAEGRLSHQTRFSGEGQLFR